MVKTTHCRGPDRDAYGRHAEVTGARCNGTGPMTFRLRETLIADLRTG